MCQARSLRNSATHYRRAPFDLAREHEEVAEVAELVNRVAQFTRPHGCTHKSRAMTKTELQTAVDEQQYEDVTPEVSTFRSEILQYIDWAGGLVDQKKITMNSVGLPTTSWSRLAPDDESCWPVIRGSQ